MKKLTPKQIVLEKLLTVIKYVGLYIVSVVVSLILLYFFVKLNSSKVPVDELKTAIGFCFIPIANLFAILILVVLDCIFAFSYLGSLIGEYILHLF